MKIVIELSKCISCGSCEAVCPMFFKLAEDGKVELLGGTKSGENLELEVKDKGCAEEAVEICPVQIIHLE